MAAPARRTHMSKTHLRRTGIRVRTDRSISEGQARAGLHSITGQPCLELEGNAAIAPQRCVSPIRWSGRLQVCAAIRSQRRRVRHGRPILVGTQTGRHWPGAEWSHRYWHAWGVTALNES
eukprot:6179877-Pleurochrysis_carterae.AAC.8